ncbi:FkbM family methyltransferase [Seohaeicola saemankumensis]|nr:FkbM family methyltransferase [Seohaeicola saemankumensis]MCA0873810.1 FkbM family methyltransferase [Seohaeicola saemankumensis]
MKDWIRAQIRRRRARRHLRRRPVQTPLGFTFVGPEPMQSGIFEEAETRLLRDLLEGADLFVNVGANYGYYICLARQMGVPAIAVEPVPINLETLRCNIALNHWTDSVTVHPVACGASEGVAEIFGEGTGASLISGWARNPKALRHRVPVRRLDALLQGEAVTGSTVLLVDVEGFELEVLRGSEALFAPGARPRWILESGLTDHRAEGGLNTQFLEIVDFLLERDYRIFSALEPDLEITRDRVTASIEQGVDLVGTHNFLLRPAETVG